MAAWNGATTNQRQLDADNCCKEGKRQKKKKVPLHQSFRHIGKCKKSSIVDDLFVLKTIADWFGDRGCKYYIMDTFAVQGTGDCCLRWHQMAQIKVKVKQYRSC